MRHLLDEISARHFPNAPATPAQLAAFELRTGWHLDADLREFYSWCDGATLFHPRPDENFRILPLAEIQRARVAMRGKDDDSMGSPAWWTLVYLGDSDYCLVDVAPEHADRFPILDAFHESYPRKVVRIAPRFADWLERTLRGNNQLWWLPG
ncbi:SMI1/KNR4 family protein [Myxococcus sp. CA051A]|uniref:SMI1/KNR4 family protein n=1 Tax=unclassified Myxococcus TaxID=2648731 RepID=UPI00157B73FC|nr:MULTISPECIES: SMI1/KNR4 family protein [unclassified Myxococcus]NTX36852.1 SMI1/KNR4 family protein [Myxococcus sp. CA033]NTX62509.1 SMI1/KNR4 family protein [Myxococcus sp. CA051A]